MARTNRSTGLIVRANDTPAATPAATGAAALVRSMLMLTVPGLRLGEAATSGVTVSGAASTASSAAAATSAGCVSSTSIDMSETPPRPSVSTW